MVECEYVNWSEVYKHADCFNRYMVECESGEITGLTVFEGVLIDTWWNVNFLKILIIFWIFSFNRYMVECELIYHKSIFADNKVLIDTWWNVNSKRGISFF